MNETYVQEPAEEYGDQIEIRDHRHNFTIIDNAVYDILLPEHRSAFIVYAVLCRFANRQRQAWPSLSRIAKLCKMSRRTIQEHVHGLEKLGLVRIGQLRKKGKFSSNLYELLEVPPSTSTTAVGKTDYGETRKRQTYEDVVEQAFTPPADPPYAGSTVVVPAADGSERATNKIQSLRSFEQDPKDAHKNARAHETDASTSGQPIHLTDPDWREKLNGSLMGSVCGVYHPGFPCPHERFALDEIYRIIWQRSGPGMPPENLLRSHPSLHAFVHRLWSDTPEDWEPTMINQVRNIATWWKANRKPKDWSIPLMFSRPEEVLATAQAEQTQPTDQPSGLQRYAQKLQETGHATS